MRSVLDFYRARPVVAVIAVVVGLAVAVAMVSANDGDGIVLPVFLVAVAGLVLGALVGAAGRRRADD